MSTRRNIEKIYRKIINIASEGKGNYTEYYRYIDELITKGDYSILMSCLEIKFDIKTNTFKDVSEIKKDTYPLIMMDINSNFSIRLKKLYSEFNVHQVGFDIYSDDYGMIEINLSERLDSDYTASTFSSNIDLNFNDSGYIDVSLLNNRIDEIDIYSCTWQNGTFSEPSYIKLIDKVLNDSTSLTYSTIIPPIINVEYLITTMEVNPYNYSNYRLSLNNNRLLGSIKEVDSIYYDTNEYYYTSDQISKALKEKRVYLEVTKGDGSYILIKTTDDSLYEDDNLYNRYREAITFLIN